MPPVPVSHVRRLRRLEPPSLLLAVWALSALATAPAWAAPTDQDCMVCHAQHDLTRSEGGTGSVFVDPAVLKASPHAGLACVTCHRDVKEIPHRPALAAVACASCHGIVADTLATSAHGRARTRPASGTRAAVPAGVEPPDCAACHGGHGIQRNPKADVARCAACHGVVVEQYRAGAHGQAAARGDSAAAGCESCHGSAHTLRPHTDPAAPTSHAKLAATCASCHADRQLITTRRIAIPEAFALYERSVHGRSARADAATCNDCHGSHDIRPASDPTSPIHRANVGTTCGRCHGREAAEYAASVHGTAVARGVSDAPTCNSCHGEHLIRGPRDVDSPVSPSAVTTTCAHCHEAQGIRETYGLPAGRLSSYRDSFHGLAARGGSPAVANCASCHGFHDVLPSSDPRSLVNPKRLPQTCGRCHPGAGERFAMGPVHVATATADHPVLFTVRWVYLLLIGLTIGGMSLHNGLDFARKVRRHWQRSRPGAMDEPEPSAAPKRWFLRMTGFERLQHVLLFTSFFTLVYTGFALKFPETWLFAWFARLEHGYAWRSLIHRGAAIVMIATSLVHVGYLFSPRGRTILAGLRPQPRDLRDVLDNARYLLGLRAHPPAFESFGYIEKAEYWALVWGTGIMTLTGLVLWFENQALQLMNKWLLDLATLVHYYEAWLAFLAIVIWHLYQHIANPDVYPMNWTWLTGRISEEQLRHEHRAEWERLVAEEEAQAEAAGAAESAAMGEAERPDVTAGALETPPADEPPSPSRPPAP
jgi:cytochrome b subunit of formate dehydrogenase